MKSGVPANMDKVSFPMKPEGDWGEEWDKVIAKSEPIKKMATPGPEDMATIIYTSGKTIEGEKTDLSADKSAFSENFSFVFLPFNFRVL